MHMCAMTHVHVCHDSCTCVPWLTHVCATTSSTHYVKTNEKKKIHTPMHHINAWGHTIHTRILQINLVYIHMVNGRVWPHLNGIWPHLHGIWPHLNAIWPHLHGVWPHLHGKWPYMAPWGHPINTRILQDMVGRGRDPHSRYPGVETHPVDTRPSLCRFRTHFLVRFVPHKLPLPRAHWMVLNDMLICNMGTLYQ